MKKRSSWCAPGQFHFAREKQINDGNQQEVQAQKHRAQMEALTKLGLCEQQVERLTAPDKLVEIYDTQYADGLLRFASACNKAVRQARQHADALQRDET